MIGVLAQTAAPSPTATHGGRSWNRSAYIFIFALSVLTRVAGLAIAGRLAAPPDLQEPVLVAMRLAGGSGFSSPYGVELDTGPTAIVPPGFALLLGGIFALFGTGTAGAVAQRLVAIVISSIGLAVLPSVAARLGLGRTSGIIAGFSGALLPIFFWVETSGAWEAPLLGLSLELMATWTLMLWMANRHPGPLYGIAWGTVLLFAPSFVFVMLALLCLWVTDQRRRSLRVVMIALGCAFLVVAPWLLRNYAVFGKIFWIRSNAGLELYLSNNAKASPLFADNLGNGSYDVHPTLHPPIAWLCSDRKEVEYFNELGRRSMLWISQHPSRFLELTARRMFFFWFPRMKRPAQTLGYAAITLLSLAGLVAAFRRSPAAACVITLVLVSYSLLYYVVQADPRYRYPLHGLTLILAGFAAVQGGQWIAAHRKDKT